MTPAIANFISEAINTVFSSGPPFLDHAPLVLCQVEHEEYYIGIIYREYIGSERALPIYTAGSRRGHSRDKSPFSW